MMYKRVDNCVINPPDYDSDDDYWIRQLVLKDPKQEEAEFYSAYGYFHSSSLYPLPDYAVKNVADAPRFNWYEHHSKSLKKKMIEEENTQQNHLVLAWSRKRKRSVTNHHYSNSTSYPSADSNKKNTEEESSISNKPRLKLKLRFKKQRNSLSWLVTIKENSAPETPYEIEEDQAHRQLNSRKSSACNVIYAPHDSAVNRVPVLLTNQDLIKNMIVAAMGSCDGLMLLIQKKLTLTDVSKQQNRLSIPKTQVKNDFLNCQEKQLRNIRVKLLIFNHHNLQQAYLQEDKVHSINFTTWKMNKSTIYALNRVWYEVVLQHNLEEGMEVQQWAFRVQSQLCFALVKI